MLDATTVMTNFGGPAMTPEAIISGLVQVENAKGEGDHLGAVLSAAGVASNVMGGALYLQNKFSGGHGSPTARGLSGGGIYFDIAGFLWSRMQAAKEMQTILSEGNQIIQNVERSIQGSLDAQARLGREWGAKDCSSVMNQ